MDPDKVLEEVQSAREDFEMAVSAATNPSIRLIARGLLTLTTIFEAVAKQEMEDQ